MPVQTGKDNKGCFARWGDKGKRYYYTCGNDSAKGKAKQKAYKQGLAIGEVLSDKSWSDVNKSKLPKSAFLWIEGNGKKKSQWHLPYKDEDGNINLNALRAIAAAIAGVRTGKSMNIPSDVKKKISKLLKRHGVGQKEDNISNSNESENREAEIALHCLILAKNFNSY